MCELSELSELSRCVSPGLKGEIPRHAGQAEAPIVVWNLSWFGVTRFYFWT
jgi:hypothetical protein